MRTLWSRVLGLFHQRRREADLASEIHAHIDQLADEYVRRGLSPAEARSAARREFGGVEQTKERYRDRRGFPLLDSLRQDLRFGCRLLVRSPGFAFAAVAILALGIGATTAIFSLVDASLLRPLPYPNPERVVMIWERTPRFGRAPTSPLTFVEWREQSRSFEAMAVATGAGGVVFSDAAGKVENAPAFSVTPDFFSVFGVVPVAGRVFVDEDARLQRNVAVVSERLWKTRFGGGPGLIGRVLTVPGAAQPLTVVGIVPADFRALAPADVWLLFGPITRAPAQRRNHFLRVVARLKPGVSIDAAQSEMSAIAANIAREAPDTNKDIGALVVPMRESIVGDDLHTTSVVLGGVVVFVLLLACANVANLLLARGITRTREIAIRAALGGGRGRIVRQLLTEAIVLAALGGAVGLTLAWVAVRMAPTVLPPGTIPEGIDLKVDGRLAVFAVVVTLMTALLAALAPTWRAARVTLTQAVADGRPGTRYSRVFRHALTVVELSAALLLAVGAGLLVRTLISLDNVDAGYRADRVLTAQVSIELARYPTHESRMQLYRALRDEIARVPGVRVAALGFDVPFAGWGGGQLFRVVGAPLDDPSRHPAAHYQPVASNYFEALGIPVRRGRAFSDRDTATSPPVCIVNEEFARRYLGRDPIGTKLEMQTLALAPTTVIREVVGVVAQVKERPDAKENQIEIYAPIEQNSWFTATIVVRAAVPPETLLPSIRAGVDRVRKDLPPVRFRTMEQIATESTAAPRFRARLVTAFAVLAIALAVAGVFSVFTFTAQQRSREFSIRMALGARSADVLRHVLGDGAKVIAIGLAMGLAAAAALTRSMSSLLFDVRPFDLMTFAGAAAVLGLIALSACALPAMRASRANPAATLRDE